MKTKLSVLIVLLFLMACGSSEQKTETVETATASSNPKFILKAGNMMYLAIQPDSTIKATESDPTKAEVFEKVDLGDGKTAIKTANGMYITDNRANNSALRAFCDHASDWEQFEIIALDQSKINIKSSAGKYMSADLSNGGLINVNSERASDWETFIMEQK